MNARTVLFLLIGFCAGAVTTNLHAMRQSVHRVPDALAAAPEQYAVEFENPFVRVTRVAYGPHAKAPMHSHPAPGGVVIALTDQDARLTSPDGVTREVHYKAGQVRWAASTPGADASTQSAHAEENLSDKPFALIRVDLKPR